MLQSAGPLERVDGEGHRRGDVEGGQDPGRRRLLVGHLLGVRARYSMRKAAWSSTCRARERRRALAQALRHPQGRGVHQLDRRQPGADQVGQRAGGGLQRREDRQARGRRRKGGHGAERRLGDERQRALAAHHEVGEDVDGPVVVQQGVDAVAHRVLHRELLAHDADGLLVAADAVAELREALPQLGFVVAQPLVGVVGRAVDDRAAGQHDDEGVERAVGVELGAARHPAGVVGHDPADGAGDLAGRVGPELAAVAGEVGVDGAHRRSGLHAHPGATVEDLHRAEGRARVGEDPGGDPLAGQARAARAEGQRHAALVAGTEQRRDVSGRRGVATDSGTSR